MKKFLSCHNCKAKTAEENLILKKNIFQKHEIQCPRCKCIQLKPKYIEIKDENS